MDGTPFLFLHAVERAENSINQGKSKPFKIDAHFHFVDKSKSTIDFLKEQLVAKGYLGRLNVDIFLHNESFNQALPKISQSIAARTARKTGRSLFLLDQKGYTSVPFEAIRGIFDQFNKAECILTFAIDWLIDYLTDESATSVNLAPIGLSQGQINDFLSSRGEPGNRYAVQQLLLGHIHKNSGAEFATPFFIKSREARKDLWLVHLSRHAKARNVMVDSHWSVKNQSIHQGKGGLEINGFNPDIDDMPNFMFADHEVELMRQTLAQDIASRLGTPPYQNPIAYSSFINNIVNETAARLIDIDEAVSLLGSEGEVQLLSNKGSAKRSQLPNATDQISLSRQRKFYFK